MKGRRRGWAAEPSFRSPHRIGAPLEKGPGAAAGALLMPREKLALFPRDRARVGGMVRALRPERGLASARGVAPRKKPRFGGVFLLAREPVEAGLADAVHFLLVQEADAAADHAEDAAGEEGPRFGV